MKVGFVSIIKEAWGGSEELWAAGALELISQGHQVVVSTLWTNEPAPKMKQVAKAGAKIIRRRGYIAPGISVKERVSQKILLFLKNKSSNPYKSFFDEQLNVVVYTGACDSLKDDPFFLGLVYSKKIPLIIINQVHTEYVKTFDSAESIILQKAFSYAQKNLFVSERNRHVMERFLAAAIPNAAVIRNPVNIATVAPLPHPKNERVQLAMVANLLINHKAQDIVFDVLRSEKWQSRNWHLNLYGNGVDEIYLKQLSSFYKLNDRITFHGKVADIRALWQTNDILLMPSRLEGIPLALVEAMLCARPSVVTDVAGHTEWITAGEEGFVAEGSNTFSFDDAMERAWNRKNDWETMGKNAYNKALKCYDPAPGKTLSTIISDVFNNQF